MPPSQVSAITGISIGTATNTQLDETDVACSYATSNEFPIQIVVSTSDSSDAFAAKRNFLLGGETAAAPLVSVTGVGDKALASASGLAVMAGKYVIVVTGVPGEVSGHYAQDIKLAKAVISALG